MRMADQRGKRRTGRTLVQNRLESAGRTFSATLRSAPAADRLRKSRRSPSIGLSMRMWGSFHDSFYARWRCRSVARALSPGRAEPNSFTQEDSPAASQCTWRRRATVFWLHHERSFRAQYRLIPSRSTRQLCEIESTTYHEGAVGDFLADFLAARGWDVEKTPVEQPPESAHAGAALERLCGHGRADPGSGVFHAHGHRSALHPLQRGCRVHVRPRRFATPRASWRRKLLRPKCCGERDFGWIVICERRRARLGRRQGGQPEAARAAGS